MASERNLVATEDSKASLFTRVNRSLDSSSSPSVASMEKDIEIQAIPYEKTSTPKNGVTVVEQEMLGDNSMHHAGPPTMSEVFGSLRIGQILTWAVLIVIPLLFVALGIVIISINGQSEESLVGYAVQQAVKLAVSMWPIAFAAVVAQSLRALATFQAERGIKLITLEELMGSQSLASAIKQPFYFQHLDIVSVGLLFLWGLSPIASQALLRISYLDIDGTTIAGSVNYTNTTARPVGLKGPAYIATVDALFLSALLAPPKIQVSSMDIWGNVKIPLVQLTNSTQWQDVKTASASNTTLNYTSLVGIPSGTFTAGNNTMFTLTSAYFDVACSPLETTNASTALNSSIALNASSSNTLYVGASSNSDNKSGRIDFASSDYSSHNGTYTTTSCTFNPVIVDSQVLCTGTDCWVDSMRLSPSGTSIFTPLNSSDLTTFISSFVNAGSAAYPGHYTLVEEYLQGGASRAGEYDGDADLAPTFRSLPLSVFQTRLSLLLNTYWQCGMVPSDQTGTLGTDEGEATLIQTPATFVANDLVWRSNWAWLAVFLGSSMVLLCAAIMGAMWAARTIVGEEILGFASGWTLNSRYIDVPDEKVKRKWGPMAGVAGKLGAVGDVKVMLLDVQADSEVGKVALGTMGEGRVRVRSGRRYT